MAIFQWDIPIFTAMKLVLLGYMGAGKSSVGQLLAEVLSMYFIDLDAYIEGEEGATVSQIFELKGEIYFRKKEAIYLNKLLLDRGNAIIALGGGTPCYGSVMKDLLSTESVTTLYLKNSVTALTERLWKERKHRPLISHVSSKEALNDFVRKHLFERGFYYNQAEIIVDCDLFSQKEIAEKIVLRLF